MDKKPVNYLYKRLKMEKFWIDLINFYFTFSKIKIIFNISILIQLLWALYVQSIIYSAF